MARRNKSNPVGRRGAPNSLQQNAQQSVQQVHSISSTNLTFQGPLPPPELLKQYDSFMPGAAERIMAMAESETRHRHSQESLAINANIEAQRKQLEIAEQQSISTFKSDAKGQNLGFFVSILCVGGAIYLGVNGQPWLAGVLGGLPLAGIIRAFKDKPANNTATK